MELSTMVGVLLGGYATSLQIFAVTLVGSLPLGVLVAVGRLSRLGPLRLICQLFISVMRGTPLMLQMFAVFFTPYFVFGIKTGPSFMLAAVLIAFVINYAAYFAEIYRSGIQSIPRGQYEAAEVLGYGKRQTFFRIILPQVVKRVLPAMGNEIVTLVKDTSLAFSIGIAEMFTEGRALVSSQRSMTPFIIAALIYWVTCLVIEFVLRRVERKLGYYHD
ncbi:amino acid ABC transporter permease [Olsenella sp. HMSC062G07]|uniref:amino acid ABC transporter permease n=1 Tax=Olsenella sp. HMSC062G07 TaxID=1739330 RepID=UPI0008A4E76A|nr:amino acid ABC transporter permease [Olsenella sp. HMSC062G07]OFK24822.1 polar amino acid ABC transporter permease [Olsenella sp. HMSC062G07]